MKISSLLKKLSLDKQEFHYQFESHPDYPSNLAFSDTLNLLGIKNEAYILEKEFWDELPDEYIGIVDGTFSIVKKEQKDYKIYSEKMMSLTKNQLYEKSTNLVILFEKIENRDAKAVSTFNVILYMLYISVILYSIIKFTWYETLFNILSLAGIFISKELFKQKFGTDSSIVTNICGGNNATAFQASCDKIFDSDRTNILGLKISDISLVYFLTTIFIGLLFPFSSSVLKITTLLSLTAIAYSFFVQIFVEKVLCKICMTINIILILQILISISCFTWIEIDETFPIITIMLFVTVFLSVAYINSILLQREEYKKSSSKSMRFIRNYKIFKHILLTSDQIEFKSTKAFFVGKKTAKIHISLISNPYCRFCKNAHKLVIDLIARYPVDVSAQIRFNYVNESQDSEYSELLSYFKWNYDNKSEHEFIEIIDRWFNINNIIEINKISYPLSAIDLSEITEIGIENMIAGLDLTPTIIINGYMFPKIYDREDIYYFIDKLVDDADFNLHGL
ncbi:vitamin K epoxide reductase family protein [Chryseobacterium terrae]|uniref:Vitamin K epoxide reductase family protein n=1 Tax=Chryseobacterium terrae TaxID=3163299 RepID=A0ABW8Y6U2_9FLAO